MANPKSTFNEFSLGYDRSTDALLGRGDAKKRARDHGFVILHTGELLENAGLENNRLVKDMETPNLRPHLDIEYGLPTKKRKNDDGRRRPEPKYDASAARYDANAFPDELKKDAPNQRNTFTPKPRPR